MGKLKEDNGLKINSIIENDGIYEAKAFVSSEKSPENIINIPIENLRQFDDHPFKLYEGEKLNEMIESIKKQGVLSPIIARKINKEQDLY